MPKYDFAFTLGVSFKVCGWVKSVRSCIVSFNNSICLEEKKSLW